MVKFTNDGPMMFSWNGSGDIPKYVTKLSLEQSAACRFDDAVLANVSNNKKSKWVEACLNKEAMITKVIEFTPREGLPFLCEPMKKPFISTNRQEQIEHQLSCISCSMLLAVDFHPKCVPVPSFLIWQVVYRGSLELWHTRGLPQPSFNNMIQKNEKDRPCSTGSTLLISGLGRHADGQCTDIAKLSPSAGVTNAMLTLYMRTISVNTKVRGRAMLNHRDFRPGVEKFLQALNDESDYRLSKLLEKAALSLCPLLREVPIKVRSQEHPDIQQFKATFYNEGDFVFKYSATDDKLSPVNSILDKTGANLLFLLQAAKAKGFTVSLAAVMGDEFINEFIIRNLVPENDGYRLSAALNFGPIFFDKKLVL